MTPFLYKNKPCNYEWKPAHVALRPLYEISIFTLYAFDPPFGIHEIRHCERLQSTGYILGETTDPYGSFHKNTPD